MAIPWFRGNSASAGTRDRSCRGSECRSKIVGASARPRFRAPTGSFRSTRRGIWTPEDGSRGVPTFNFHMHLPHYAVTTDDPKAIHVLARQPVDVSRPHPFVEAGNKEFNMFLWMPPAGDRAGDILLADSTIFTTLFGGDESLETFWKNIATR